MASYVIVGNTVRASGHVVNDSHLPAIAPEVQTILRDDVGVQEAREALDDLVKADFQSPVLNRVLAPPTSFDEWRVGEALAEHHLASVYGCEFPWPDGRSTRNPNSSAGGVDLIGFQRNGRMRFVFAEVKTSHHQSWPPSVMTSRHGLHSQILGLSAGDDRSTWAIRYVAMNGKDRPWFASFREAMATYLADTLDVVVYGVLVHAATPDPRDLQAESARMSSAITAPTVVELVAIYVKKGMLATMANASVVVETAA